MFKKKKRDYFSDSIGTRLVLFEQYYNLLYELAISMFRWVNLPETVDPRFLEVTLFENGQALFFRDDVLGELALKCAANGPFDVYNVPVSRRAYASNGFHADLTNKDSVLIYNNYSRVATAPPIKIYATRLANLDMAIDVNVNAQKTPMLITCDESERLTMQNLYMQYEGNIPVIFGSRALRADSLKVLKTDAPFVADKLAAIRTNIWNDALGYLGIPNIPYQKRERLVGAEVTQSMGGTMASRFGRLNARKDACRLINKMFGLNVDCEYREDLLDLISFPTHKPGEESSIEDKAGGE